MTRPLRHGLVLAVALLATGHLARAQARIDVNHASADTLTRLPGIGKVKARRIVAYRTANGPFRSVNALRRVKGIGKTTLARIRPLVTLGPPTGAGAGGASDPAASDPGGDGGPGGGGGGGYDLDLTRSGGAGARGDPARSRASGHRGHHRHRATKDPPTGKVNVNTADAKGLEKLPGIGPAKAQAIIAERTAQGPFHSVDALIKVPGIGPKTLAKLRPWVTVRVDLNRADLHDLEAIGLDTASAERLLSWRHEHGRFNRVADLTRVSGFGEGALETLRPLLWVGDP